MAQALFGDHRAVATWDLPGRLRALSLRLPVSMGSDVLCSRLTLAPYYTAFSSEETRAWLTEAMGASVASAHMRLGIIASRVSRPKSPRYCPGCNAEAMERYGELYWRRTHQLPGVLVCSAHAIPLRESPIILDRLNRHGYLAADVSSCPSDGGRACCGDDPASLALLHAIAVRSATLLTDPPPAMDATEIELRYRDMARRAGLMRTSARVDVERLVDGFRGRFAPVSRDLAVADPTLGGGDGWLVAMTRRHRKAVHPLFHVLATMHLETLPPACDPLPARPSAFGPGPWPCRNPLAAHFGAEVIKGMKWYRNRDAVVGVFACSCGYEYTRGIAPSGKLGPPRYRTFGPTLRPALVAAMAEGASLRSTARRLGLDPKTVVTEMHALGLTPPWSCGKPRRASRPFSVRPQRRRRRSAAPRSDWITRDREEAIKVRHAASVLRNQSPPVRVTAAAIERHLGRRGWLRHRRDKLPLANAALDDAGETVTAFQRRRLARAIDIVLSDGEAPSAWRAIKIAGLRFDWRDEAVAMLAARSGRPRVA